MNELEIYEIHKMSTYLMVGLIWIVQLVHYPAFHFIEDKSFTVFESFHQKRISFIVFPFMLMELVSGLVILAYQNYSFISIVNLSSVVLIWLCTILISMPLHKKLSCGKDLNIIKKLIKTNWLRTFVWSFRGVGVFYFSGGLL